MTDDNEWDVSLIDPAWVKHAIEVIRAHEFAARSAWPGESPLPALPRPPANDIERGFLERLETRAHVRLVRRSSAVATPHDLAARAVALIRARHADPLLQQSEIASDLQVSPPTLSRLLAPITGRTFPEHLRDARLDAACVLLHTSPMSIAAIAKTVGYPDPGDLSHYFHQRFETTPTAWRTIHQPPIPRCILVVDDHEPLRLLYARWIEALGMTSRIVASPDEALTALSDVEADAVVTDYDMRPTTGLDLLQAIRKQARWKALPVGIVTAAPELPSPVKRQITSLGGHLLEAFVQSAEFEMFLWQLLALNRPGNPEGRTS